MQFNDTFCYYIYGEFLDPLFVDLAIAENEFWIPDFFFASTGLSFTVFDVFYYSTSVIGNWVGLI